MDKHVDAQHARALVAAMIRFKQAAGLWRRTVSADRQLWCVLHLSALKAELRKSLDSYSGAHSLKCQLVIKKTVISLNFIAPANMKCNEISHFPLLHTSHPQVLHVVVPLGTIGAVNFRLINWHYRLVSEWGPDYLYFFLSATFLYYEHLLTRFLHNS